jgi:hypothetical protein
MLPALHQRRELVLSPGSVRYFANDGMAWHLRPEVLKGLDH